ncbi:hypothetical protein N8I77_007350 [Diaporthe amygdali]|uniref:Uncharacterized protein n=1 Tax=Phomopsis amygdali TaxID=1214568 RepID=A0AAD9W1H1_PHOAM|nr:hypothetical protein N8I77_007350 [Diaporthe amygdali]
MASSKRPNTDVEHNKVTLGRSKIRRGKDGKALVDAIRNNVLLFLQNLSDEEAQNYSQKKFESTLSSAVAGALDPGVGPEAVVDLREHGYDNTILYANKQGGQLMASLLNLIDDNAEGLLAKMRQNLDVEKARADKVEQTLAYLQGLIPISPAGQSHLSMDIEALEEPGANSGWMYGVLWAAVMQWMDARLRQMRMYGQATGRGPKEPPSLDERTKMINTRVHGGDLRVDAIICMISFGDHRHADPHYQGFFKDAFVEMYQLKVDDGYWLDQYKPYAAHVTSLITQARNNENWQANGAALQTLDTREKAVINMLKKCTVKKNPTNQWDLHKTPLKNWPPAAYLRDAPGTQQRTAGTAGARMTLRTQPRVNYGP